MERIFLTNRIIRNYLQLFGENKWKDVIKYTLIYGIQALQLRYPLTSLSPQLLEEILLRNELLLTAGELHQSKPTCAYTSADSEADFVPVNLLGAYGN